MRFRESSRRLIALLLALITVLSIPISAGAISYDGTGTSGKGTANSSGNGTYGIYSATLSRDLVGYRFTGIKADGSRAYEYSLDVIFNDSAYLNPQNNLLVMHPKYSKLEIHNAYDKFVANQGSTLELKDYAVFGEVSASGVRMTSYLADERTIWESELGLPSGSKLPKNADALGDWQKDNNNLNPIAKKVGYSGGISSMKGGDKIIAEPLYVAKLEGADHAVTPSELALYTALTMTSQKLDIMSDDGQTGGGADNNPTFIRKYTNYYFPNSYRTPDGQGLWDSAAALPAISGNLDAEERASYGKILREGYGAVIMYTGTGPKLPDYYIGGIRFYDAERNQYDPMGLPLNKTIYVVVDYNCYSTQPVNSYDYANLFYYNHKYPSSDIDTSVNSTRNYWTVIKTKSHINGGSLSSLAQWQTGTSGNYNSVSASARHVEKYYKSDQTEKIIITTLYSSSVTVGYMCAQIQKKNCVYATLDNEINTSNNTMRVMYRFADKLERDVETTKIVLKNANGTEYSNYKAIPFGETVYVYHAYKSNSKAGGGKVGEPSVSAYAASKSDGYYKVKIDGAHTFALGTSETLYCIGSFNADSLVNQYRYGGVYLGDDYSRTMPKESNKDNNTKSITWRAKCNVQLYQIIFHDGNGTTYATKTRGQTYNAPTFAVGSKVYVTYVYKNTSQKELCVNGYNTNGGNCTKYKVKASDSYTNNENMWVPAGGTILVDGGSFTVAADGKINGSVYVNKATYGIPSSWGKTDCETNVNDNTMEAVYYAKDRIDLEIVKIQYVYIDDNGKNHTTTIKRGETGVAQIPYGEVVTVWYTFKNNSDKPIKIDGYYAYNKTGTPGSLMSSTTNADYNANGVTVAAGDTLLVTSGTFRATTLGEAYYYGAVFQDGKTSATGESNTTNNTMTAKYKVVGYDVAITDIYFKDAAGTEFSKGSDSAEMDYGKNYKIYYTIKNNSTSPIYVNVYNDIEPGNGIGVCVTPAAQATTGIRLEVGQSRDVYVGDWDAADQMIGINPVGASVFLGTNTSATNFTYDGKTGTEVNTTNNVREEDVTLKFDVAITNIYFTTTDGGIQMKPNANGVIAVPANVELICYYVLKNNTAAAVDVNIYYEANGVVNSISEGPKIKVITLAAGEEKTVVAGRMGFTVSSSSSTTTKVIKGHVYRDGQEIKGDSCEKTFDNNIYEVTLNIYKTPYLTAIAPNASYRVGTDVITSFYLHNPTTTHYTGITASNALRVKFTVKSLSGDVLYTFTQNAIVPALCEGTTYPASYSHGEKGGAQLVFFKWSMPEEYAQSMVVVEAELSLPNGLVTTRLANNRRVCSNEVMNTPDTQYEANPPANWQTLVNANAPFGNTASRSWYVYTYSGGRFIRESHHYVLSVKNAFINPMSATTQYDGSHYYMRSGYGVKLTSTGYQIVSKNATSDMYTDVQYAYATWQEFGYSTKEGKITTLEKVGSQWQLPEYLDYANADGTGKRIHFTPIWYPNHDYSAYVCFSDIWTPMGMLTVARETNEIQIRDDMYEDWYIGHG